MSIDLVLATRNRKKLRELSQILEDLPVSLKTVDDFPDVPDVEETGATFEENARLKAEAVARATGCWALADDSGLEVDALGGRPGVFSARWSGPDATDEKNRKFLLEALAKVPGVTRGARFVCVVVVASPVEDGGEFRGECEGVIIDEERGGGGFGYDPLFFLPQYGKTMAEIPRGLKNTISHRARALAQAREFLRKIGKLGSP